MFDRLAYLKTEHKYIVGLIFIRNFPPVFNSLTQNLLNCRSYGTSYQRQTLTTRAKHGKKLVNMQRCHQAQEEVLHNYFKNYMIHISRPVMYMSADLVGSKNPVLWLLGSEYSIVIKR